MYIFHISLWAAVFGWTVAQTTKMIICLVQSRRLNFGYLVSTGGMPSAPFGDGLCRSDYDWFNRRIYFAAFYSGILFRCSDYV